MYEDVCYVGDGYLVLVLPVILTLTYLLSHFTFRLMGPVFEGLRLLLQFCIEMSERIAG